MKKKIFIGAGIILVSAGLIGFNIWKQAAEGKITAEVTTLQEEEIVETVMTPGTLKLAEQQTIYYSPEKGEIAEFFIKEGDEVKKGTPLFRYENKQLELEKKQNELQLQSGRLQLNDIREQHKKLDEQLEDDPDNEQLQSEHDQLKLQQQQAELELEQVRLQKESLEQQIAELEVKSDIDGIVVELNEEGAFPSSQAEQRPVVQIGSLNQLIVEGVISEYDTLKIKEGQAVKLTSDAVPDQSWKGTVSLVSYLPEEANMEGMEGGTSGVQYPIEVTVEDKNLNLKPGFQMVVEIVTNEHRANTLPLSAVKQDGDVNTVYVVNNGKAERREVKVGSVSNEKIEIIEGVLKDEQVIVDPADNVTDGMEVTIE